MKNSIYDFLNEDEKNTGLYIAALPTGYGKTYSTIHAIYDYIKSGGKKKVLFTTNLIKNLPVEDLKEIYSKDGRDEEFDKEVLLIKSNFDYIYENLLKVDIPNEFKESQYEKLMKRLITFKKLENNKDLKDILNDIEGEIKNKLEPAFREYIRGIIKKNLPKDIEKRKMIIKNDIKYKWIGDIYPTVFTDEYKVIFLSIAKFLVKNSVLVDQSYSFISEEKIKNTLIVIDEFDAAKKIMEKKIIDKVLSSNEDYFNLFMNLYNLFETHKFPKDIQELIKKRTTIFNELNEERKEIFEYFKLGYNYKTKSDDVDKGQNFIFNDGTYHTLLRNNKKYIRAKLSEESQNISISFEKKEVYHKSKSEDDIQIYSLFRRINSFLKRFKFLIFDWSKKYMENVNRGRGENEEKFTLENAIKTIFNEFGIEKKQRELLISELDVNLNSINDEKAIVEDTSFYNNGFKLFEFEDKDEHLTKTVIRYIDNDETPEKILLYLCKIAKVLGISATADIKSVTSNFDLDYLQGELKEDFRYIEDEIYEKIEEELKRDWKAYESGEVKVEVCISNENKNSLETEERLFELFENRRLANKYLNKIRTSKEESYIEKRYCDLFEVIKEFVIQDDIRSFLCLNSIIPKNNDYKFDINIFKEVLEELVLIYKKSKMDLVVLKGDNFVEDKEQVLKRLSDGEKIFIMSSYQTIGAGQNLQYKPYSMENLVEIKKSNDSRNKYKDIDAIFLGKVTNLSVNIYGEEKISKEELLKMIFQLEYLYENNEISYSDLDNLVKLAFKKYTGSKDINSLYSKVSESKSIRREITKELIQAVGRICRTYIKNKKIYIYTLENVISKMDLNVLENKVLNPEMRNLSRVAREFSRSYMESNEVKNKAERISFKGKNFILKMLSKEWNETSVKLWKELRECTLKFPTVRRKVFESNEIIHRLYITSEKPMNKYFFYQKNDFNEVSISFDENRYKLKSQLNIEEKEKRIFEVSMESARLEALFKYKGLKEWFKENEYATEFSSEEFMLSPVLFNNIYKGALGEVAGKFILENELKISLKEIDEYKDFEFFDFMLSEGVYIDFKHWKQGYSGGLNREDALRKIKNKLKFIGGKKVYIINILGKEDHVVGIKKNEEIIEIPYLLDENSNLNKEAIRMLMEEITNDLHK